MKSAAAPAAALPTDPESIRRFAELLKLRTLTPSTQAEYVRSCANSLVAYPQGE
jgi:hypothetical protein